MGMSLLAAAKSVTVDLTLLNLVSGLIPILTALITKKLASSRLKTFITSGLSVITGSLVALIKNDGVIPDVEAWAIEIALAFMAATAAYVGFLKPSGVAEAVQNVAPEKGLGKATVETQPVLVEAPKAVDLEAAVGDLLLLQRDELIERAAQLNLTLSSRATKRDLAEAIANASLVGVADLSGGEGPTS